MRITNRPHRSDSKECRQVDSAKVCNSSGGSDTLNVAAGGVPPLLSPAPFANQFSTSQVQATRPHAFAFEAVT